MKRHSTWVRRAGAVLMLSTLACAHAQPAGPQDAPDVPDAPFRQTLAVCMNLDKYAVLASVYRTGGIPLDVSLKGVVPTARQSVKLPAAQAEAFAEVVADLFRRIYADPSLKVGGFDDAIFAACSTYNGYQIDRARLRQAFDGYVPSLLKPQQRVSVCVKAAEAVAKIGVGRDQGMARDAVADSVRKELDHDTRTQAALPGLVEEVYANPELQAPTLYMYHLGDCASRKTGKPLPPLARLGAAAQQCQAEPDKDKKLDCLGTLFGGAPVAARANAGQ